MPMGHSEDIKYGFTEKNEFGATELFACSDITGIRTENPLDKWYASGKLGIISRTSEIVPEGIKAVPHGFYVTFVVDNADEMFEIAKGKGFEILSEPEDTFYGQRRLLLKDPDGTIIDVSSPIPNFG